MTAPRLTEGERRVLVDLSDGSWSQDFDRIYSGTILRRLKSRGLIRDDHSGGPLAFRNWTSTQDGINAVVPKQ